MVVFVVEIQEFIIIQINVFAVIANQPHKH